jgi:cytoskeletal protein CcmA (bactofilin family)
MIRMGRSSKSEDTSKETSALHDQSSTTAFPFREAQTDEQNLAVSESESMARDIKDGKLSGFVGAGTVLTGETNFQSMLRVDGHLTGRVTSEDGTLIIGSTGQVDANIDVASAIVNGMVNGDIVAGEKLELGRTARVVGNIKTPRLVMEDGAILEGGCNMVKSKETFDNRIEEQKRQFATNDLTPISEEEEAETETDDEFESLSDTQDTDSVIETDDSDESDDDAMEATTY